MEDWLLYLAVAWFAGTIILSIWQTWRYISLANLKKDYPLLASDQLPPLSLIIACHNEAENLSQNLEHWLQLDYPDWEIILINDFSTDQTWELMQAAAEKNARIQIINRSKGEGPGKKQALSTAIAQAQHQNLVFCDADCRPLSKDWLRYIGSSFSQGKELILGYGKLEGNGAIQGLVDFETVRTALSFWHYAYRGSAYMGVGRNIAYTKRLFEQANGFDAHLDLRSGDDDLFVHAVAEGANIEILRDPNSFTVSQGPESYRAWIRQKGRHYSTAWRYKLKYQLSLGLEGSLVLLFWLLLGFALVLSPLVSLALLFSRMSVQLSLSQHQEMFAKAKNNLYWPLWEILYVLSTFVLHIKNLFISNKREW